MPRQLVRPFAPEVAAVALEALFGVAQQVLLEVGPVVAAIGAAGLIARQPRLLLSRLVLLLVVVEAAVGRQHLAAAGDALARLEVDAALVKLQQLRLVSLVVASVAFPIREILRVFGSDVQAELLLGDEAPVAVLTPARVAVGADVLPKARPGRNRQRTDDTLEIERGPAVIAFRAVVGKTLVKYERVHCVAGERAAGLAAYEVARCCRRSVRTADSAPDVGAEVLRESERFPAHAALAQLGGVLAPNVGLEIGRVVEAALAVVAVHRQRLVLRCPTCGSVLPTLPVGLGRLLRVELHPASEAAILGPPLRVGKEGVLRQVGLVAAREVAILAGKLLFESVSMVSMRSSHVTPQREFEAEDFGADRAAMLLHPADDNGDMATDGDNDLAVSLAAKVDRHRLVVGAYIKIVRCILSVRTENCLTYPSSRRRSTRTPSRRSLQSRRLASGACPSSSGRGTRSPSCRRTCTAGTGTAPA